MTGSAAPGRPHACAEWVKYSCQASDHRSEPMILKCCHGLGHSRVKQKQTRTECNMMELFMTSLIATPPPLPKQMHDLKISLDYRSKVNDCYHKNEVLITSQTTSHPHSLISSLRHNVTAVSDLTAVCPLIFCHVVPSFLFLRFSPLPHFFNSFCLCIVRIYRKKFEINGIYELKKFTRNAYKVAERLFHKMSTKRTNHETHITTVLHWYFPWASPSRCQRKLKAR
jgi:hypothetical protein